MLSLNLVTYLKNINNNPDFNVKLKPTTWIKINEDIQELVDTMVLDVTSKMKTKTIKPEILSQTLLNIAWDTKMKEKKLKETSNGETEKKEPKKPNTIKINVNLAQYVVGGENAVLAFRQWNTEKHEKEKECGCSATIYIDGKPMCEKHSKSVNGKKTKTKKDAKCGFLIKKLYPRSEKANLNIQPSRVLSYVKGKYGSSYSLSSEIDIFLAGYAEHAVKELLVEVKKSEKYEEAPWVRKGRENDISTIKEKYEYIEDWETQDYVLSTIREDQDNEISETSEKLLAKIYYDFMMGNIPKNYKNFIMKYHSGDAQK